MCLSKSQGTARGPQVAYRCCSMSRSTAETRCIGKGGAEVEAAGARVDSGGVESEVGIGDGSC